MVERTGALGYFGDARRAAVGTDLIERVTATGSLVIRKLGETRAGELAIHRFLSAPSVTCQEMLGTLAGRTLTAASGRRIVVAQDTTEINFAAREANRRGLGPAGDGVSAGFFIHPLVAIDSETEAVLGLLDAHIWTRDDAIEAAPRRQRAMEDKESIRWLRGVERAAALLTDAASVVVVGDRENDIYSCFARRPAGADLIVRAAQDRALVEDASLFASAAAWPELTRIPVKVAPRRAGDPGRIATVALRARLAKGSVRRSLMEWPDEGGPVTLRRPRHGFARTDPETVSLTLVEAREIDPPANEEPLHWRLLTTIAVGDAAAACEIVRLYRLRWRIEQVFRALKSDGMRLEGTQVHEAKRLFKLAVVGLAGACRTIQLVDARDGSPRPATDVIDAALLPVAEAIGATLEGKTERQKNRHPLHSLAWLAWIVARLGGWNCYYKPPGPKTMRAGWAPFATMTAGFTIATALQTKSNV
jgi:Transposase DDE domain